MALQTKHALLQQRDGEAKRNEKASCKQIPKQSCKECENPSAPSEPWRSTLTKHDTLNESIRKHGTDHPLNESSIRKHGTGHPLNESIRKCGTILTEARRSEVLYLATPRRTRVAKVTRTKRPTHHSAQGERERGASCWKTRQRHSGQQQTYQSDRIAAVCFHHACHADLVPQSNTVQVQRQSGHEHNKHEVQL